MTRQRPTPPLPNVTWEVAISRLPLGQPAVRLMVGGALVLLPQRDAAELGSALTTAARAQGLAARLGAATGTPR